MRYIMSNVLTKYLEETHSNGLLKVMINKYEVCYNSYVFLYS